MQFGGLIIGVMVFAIIGILHPVVIQCEYHFTKRCWPAFALAGVLCCLGSVFTTETLSTLLAVLGFSLIWSIHELIAQEKRVAKGWFPANPKRK